ncbi:MAG TPA: hypothetical protein PLX33_11190 [Alphaproteobacteria bacterium]|nr:hypothetical protein [Alphaproteobacteria bacterium]
MAERTKDAFNNSARRRLAVAAALAVGVATTPTEGMQTEYQASLLAPKAATPANLHQRPETLQTLAAMQPPVILREIWAEKGLSGEKFDAAFAALGDGQQQKLAQRSAAMFEQQGFADVMLKLAEGKQAKLSTVIERMAEMPAGMQIITTDYTRIAKEQNDAVWLEFQERAEPAFYRHLAATQEKELRAAGLCDYALDCMRRGLGPTNKEGISYNVDIDHLVERGGGGAMSTEKAVDPVHGGAPMYLVNHVSNLCLIMRDVHTQTKNVINNQQGLGEIAVGETKRICMAVPTDENRLMMLQKEELRAGMQPPPETSYFALGPSLLITRDLERLMRDNIAPPEEHARVFFEVQIEPTFNHTLKLWQALVASLDHGIENGTVKAADIKRTRDNCDGYLKPLEKAMADANMPKEAVDSLRDISNRIYAHLTPADDNKSTAPKAQNKQEKRNDARA